MQRTLVCEALRATAPQDSVFLQGWVRTRRDAKGFSFVEVNDGSCLKNIQVIVDDACPAFSEIERFTTGCSVEVEGALVESKGAGQAWEVQAKELRLVGAADESYPLQKKRHSLEYLREIGHLRPRSNLFGAARPQPSRLRGTQLFPGAWLPLCAHPDCDGERL